MPSQTSSPGPDSPPGANAPIAIGDPRSKHLSALSHDLRGSIGGLLLLAELLKADLAPAGSAAASALADVDSIRSGLLDLLGSLERHVCIERFRLGLIRARPTPIDLPTLARDLRERYTPLALERGFQLHLTGTGTAHTDRVLLTVAAAALLDNILKHGEPPLASLTLTGQPGETPSDPATWSVLAESTGRLGDGVLSELGTAPRPEEFVVNSPGGLGLRLVRAAAHALGGSLRHDPVAPPSTVRLCLSGKTL